MDFFMLVVLAIVVCFLLMFLHLVPPKGVLAEVYADKRGKWRFRIYSSGKPGHLDTIAISSIEDDYDRPEEAAAVVRRINPNLKVSVKL